MAEYVIPNFLGGINEAVDYSLLKDNEAQKAQNCNIRKGVLQNSKGYSLFTNFTATANMESAINSANKIKTIMTYYKDNEAILILAVGGKLHKLQSDTVTTIGTGFTSDLWDYVNVRVDGVDSIVMTNGVDNVKVYNGTTLRDLKHDGYASSDGPTNKAPKGKFVDLHFYRIWLGDDNKIYCSTVHPDSGIDIDDFTVPSDPPEEVDMHGGEYILNTNDGSKLIGMKIIFNDIVLYKEKSIYKMFGTDPSSYQKVQIFSAAGAIADRSIAVSEKGAFHIDRKGIYFYDGVNVSLISQRLNDTFENLNKDYLNNACGFIWDNKYILAVPEGTSTVNNLIIEYDIDNQNFMLKRGFTISSFVDYKEKLIFVGVDNKIYDYSMTDKLNGANIECFWETGYSDQGVPNATKDIENVYFTGYGLGDIKLTLTTEKGSKNKTVTLTGTETVYNVKLKARGRLVKLKVENISGSTFTIKGLKLILETDPD